LEILGITGFAPRPPLGPSPFDELAVARAARAGLPLRAAPGPAAPPPAPVDVVPRPYDSAERRNMGLSPLTRAQISKLNEKWGTGHNYNNVDGVPWSLERERKIGRGRKTYRKRISRRKTKKHI
jgi:hypothetical protein